MVINKKFVLQKMAQKLASYTKELGNDYLTLKVSEDENIVLEMYKKYIKN